METDEQKAETKVSFEIYFKQVPGAPVSYPVEDYDYLFNWRNTAVVFCGISIVCLGAYFIPEELIIGTVTTFASKASEIFKTVKFLAKLALNSSK